jgi:transcriptional regulator with XRE-family HTH domain
MSTQEENIFTIGQRFKHERVRLDLSQATLAAKIFTSDRTIKNYESGVSSPKANELFYFHREGADVQYIVCGVRSNTPCVMQDRVPYCAAEQLADELRNLDLTEQDAALVEQLARRLARR